MDAARIILARVSFGFFYFFVFAEKETDSETDAETDSYPEDAGTKAAVAAARALSGFFCYPPASAN